MSGGGRNWDDQRAFLAVLETGSLSAAARRLGVTQPTVRRRIAALEQSLGSPLFVRSNSGLAPTEAAGALGGHARAMALSAEAFRRAASGPSGSVAGRVRLSVPEFVAVEVLPPMLARLRACHPGLGIEIAASNVEADLPAQEADVAVRMVEPRQGALVARRVGTVALGLFASVDYVERCGQPRSVGELAEHDLIGPDRSEVDLRLAGASDGAVGVEKLAIRTDSHAAWAAMIRAGLGIGIMHRAAGLGDTRLLPVLPDLVIHRFETWIVMHEDLRRLARVRAVFDHLATEFAAYCKQG